jgi:hypothetical protein
MGMEREFRLGKLENTSEKSMKRMSNFHGIARWTFRETARRFTYMPLIDTRESHAIKTQASANNSRDPHFEIRYRSHLPTPSNKAHGNTKIIVPKPPRDNVSSPPYNKRNIGCRDNSMRGMFYQLNDHISYITFQNPFFSASLIFTPSLLSLRH